MFRKNNKKGLSLIELIAIIAIVGVVALITVPAVMNVIESAKRKVAKNSTYGYVRAIEKELSNVSKKEYENTIYGFDEIAVDVKGKRPTAGLYSVDNEKVVSAVFCINDYTVKYVNNDVEIEDSCSEQDIRLKGSLKLSSDFETYAYPNPGIFEVIENISGGALSCSSNDEDIAKCSIDGNTVTVTPGKKQGQATITVTSAATSKYNEAKVAHVATTEKGLLSISDYPYIGVYDGQPHTITLNTNYNIMYGTEEGEYNLKEKPTFTDVGDYNVYYFIDEEGYYSFASSQIVKITQADGKVSLKKSSGSVAYNDELDVEITENLSGGNLIATSANEAIASARVEDGKLVVTGKSTGTVRITVISEETHNYKAASTSFNVTVVKAKNSLHINSTSGTYVYPNSGTFNITENLSGGALSCTPSDNSIATCQISNNVVTVKPGKKSGSTTLTIKSASTSNYEEGVVAYVVITEKGILNSYTANDYLGIYDGNPHSITVSCEDSNITYKNEYGEYTSTLPKFTDVGTYNVDYKIEKEGYYDVPGTRTVTITKAKGSVTAPTAKTLVYNDQEQELINPGSSSTGTIQYKLQYGDYSSDIPTAMDDGTYKVYYKVIGDHNHKDVAESAIDVTILKAPLTYSASGYSGTYNGNSYGINVSSEGATIKYGTTAGTYDLDESPTYSDAGTYTVYFKITRKGYVTVTGSKNVVITKATTSLKISSTNKTYTYPDSDTFTITENTSGVTPTCSTSDSSIATCSISDNVVTVKPGTKEGNATITIKTAATKNYTAGQVAHEAITEKGIPTSYTISGYNGVYDGQPHGITVSSAGSTIKYGRSNSNYDLDESPTLTDVEEITVYFIIKKEGYYDYEGHETIKITQADGKVVPPTAKSLTYNDAEQTLINAGSSDTGTIKYKGGSNTSYSTTFPTAKNAGTYTIYYKVDASQNYKAVAENSITVTISKRNGSVTAPTAKTLAYTGSAQALVNAGSSSTGTIQYKLESTGTYSTSIPTAVNPGTYTVYYKVVGDNNHNDVAEASVSVTISKATNVIQLSANYGTYKYPTSGTFTVKSNPGNGSITCNSSNTNIATCSVSGSTITVNPGTTKGNTTLTIKTAETDYYKEGTASYVATTEFVPVPVTANNVTIVYDGNPHGITVTSSGSTIKYGESNSSYNLASSPTITDVGTKTVYYQVTKAGYEPVTGSKTITITKADGNVNPPTAKSLTYNGSEQALINAGSSTSGTIKYRVGDSGEYITSIPKATNAGKYKVYYKVEASQNYNAVAENYIEVTIAQKNGNVTAPTARSISYTGSAQNLVTAGSSTSGTVQYKLGSTGTYGTSIPTATNPGTYTVYYKVTESANYKAVAESSVTVTLSKANNTLKLSANAGTYEYPTSGSFYIDTNTSGGAISCISANTNIATCSVSGINITVTPGKTKGNTTLTIKSAATDYYFEGTAAFSATTEQVPPSYTVNSYNAKYDGKAHGISITSSGSTIKYGETSGTYNLPESPTLTNVGTKTVYFQITKSGYETVTGSSTITITKQNITVTAPTAKTLSYTGSAQNLINEGSANAGTLQYKLGSSGTYSTNVPTATAAGTYTVYYKVVGNSNYADYSEKSVSVTISKVKATVTTNPTTYTILYTGNAQNLITAGATSSGTLNYKIGTGSYSTSLPTSTNPGKYTVYYKVVGDSNHTDSDEYSIETEISKGKNNIVLSANTAEYKYPTAGTFTVNTNTSKGAISCTSKNTALATCSVSGSTITVTPKALADTVTESSVDITVTTAATDYYATTSVVHTAVLKKVLVPVTASNYSGTYDGNSHGITVTSSGSTIVYGTKSGEYTTSTNPTYKNAGTYTVYYKVTKSGYTTVTGSKTVTIKASKPTITASDGKASNAWHNADFTLTYSSSGNASNIKYYIGTTSTPSTASTSQAVNTETTGTTYYVKACVNDSSTLCSENATYIAKLDKTKPKTPTVVLYSGHDTGISNSDGITSKYSGVKFTGTAEANSRQDIRLDNVNNTIITKVNATSTGTYEFTIDLVQNVTNKVSVCSVDAAGNYTCKVIDVINDTKAPTTPSMGMVKNGNWDAYTDSTWTNTDVYFGTKSSAPGPYGSTDTGGSGVAKYQISSNNSTWVDFKYSSTDSMYHVTSNGIYKRYFRAVDKAGNVSAVLTRTAKIGKTANVYYYAQISNGKSFDKSNGGTVGEGNSTYIFQFGIYSKIPNISGNLCYSVRQQNTGELAESCQPVNSTDYDYNTAHSSLRLEAIKIRLTGDAANAFDVYYRAECQSFGWMKVGKNNTWVGTKDLSKRMEMVQVKIVPKGASAGSWTNTTTNCSSPNYSFVDSTMNQTTVLNARTGC